MGKTATTLKIAEGLFYLNKIDALLVVAPNDVHKQWATEQVPMWLTCKNNTICFGGRGGIKKFYDPADKDTLGIVCVNIDTFSTPSKWKEIVEWAIARRTMIVIDEATVIKNVNSNRTQILLTAFNDVSRRGKSIVSSYKKDNCQYRCILTGTPTTNGPMDLWALMEFVKPNYFGLNWWAFKARYGMYTKLSVANKQGQFRDVQVLLNEGTWQGIKRCTDYTMAFNLFGCTQDTYFTIKSQDKYMGPYKNAEDLKALLSRDATFVKLQDCVDMPEQTFIIKHLTMNDAQSKAYKQMKEEQLAEYKDHTMTALNKLTMSIRLQQISSGFICDKYYATEEELEGDLKPDEIVWLGDTNPKLDALMRDVDESDKPLLILTRYSAEAAKIYDMLKGDYNTMLYTGWKKTGSIDDFKEGKYDILVANTSCIARGFNLQIAHTTLFYSNTFSMELREQAIFRTWRLGQKEQCKYVDYCYDKTIDETIIKALKDKKNILEYFRTEEV